MESVTATTARAWGEKYDAQLKAGDPRFRRMVQIIDCEWSVLFFRNAFLIRRGKYIYWFAEHHPFGFTHEDELKMANEYSPISNIEEILID